MFELVKPQIDTNNKKYINGTKGGRPKTENKPNDNQTETNTKPIETKQEPNVNVNENVNVNVIKKDANASKEKASRFVPPSHQELISYCCEKKLNVDVDRFIDYYTSNGWMVGKNKMKDWKATLRNWSRKERQDNGRAAESSNSKFRNFEERDYDMDSLTRDLLNS